MVLFHFLFVDLKDHCWQWQLCWLRMLPPCNVWVARSFWWPLWLSKSTTGPGRHRFWILWTWWYASCLPLWSLWAASSLQLQQVMFWKSWTALAWQSWLAWSEWFLARITASLLAVLQLCCLVPLVYILQHCLDAECCCASLILFESCGHVDRCPMAWKGLSHVC